MAISYENQEQLFSDDFEGDFVNWHHEGVGTLQHSPAGAMRLHCLGSTQGKEGCMAFLRPDLPDHIAIEYDLTVRSQDGLVINLLAARGLKGEDLIADRAQLPPRTGIFPNYYSHQWGLQSYHVSVSRFRNKGLHTGTSNWRRNPGLILVGHGNDPVQELNRTYRIRLIKDAGSGQIFVDGNFAHAFVDHDASRPIPGCGKFGFRLIGSDAMADVANFAVYQVEPNATLWEISE